MLPLRKVSSEGLTTLLVISGVCVSLASLASALIGGVVAQNYGCPALVPALGAVAIVLGVGPLYWTFACRCIDRSKLPPTSDLPIVATRSLLMAVSADPPQQVDALVDLRGGLDDEADAVSWSIGQTRFGQSSLTGVNVRHERLSPIVSQEAVVGGVGAPQTEACHAALGEPFNPVKPAVLAATLSKVAGALRSEGIRLVDVSVNLGGHGFIIARAIDDTARALSNAEVFAVQADGISQCRRRSLVLARDETARLANSTASAATNVVAAEELLRRLDAVAMDFTAVAFETKLVSQHTTTRAGAGSEATSETEELFSSMGTIAERCAASVRDLKQLAREATELLQDSTHIIGSTQTMLSHTQQELDRLGCLMDEASETSNRQTACLSEAATACRLAEKMRGRMAVAGNCIPAMSARFYDFADQVRQLAFAPEEHSEPILRGTLKRRNRPVLRLVSNAPTNPDGTGVP